MLLQEVPDFIALSYAELSDLTLLKQVNFAIRVFNVVVYLTLWHGFIDWGEEVNRYWFADSASVFYNGLNPIEFSQGTIFLRNLLLEKL
jgi:hypothetical protein